MWVTASRTVPDAAAAEQYLGAPWSVVDAVFVAPSGEWLNNKDEQWLECPPTAPGARPGWRIVYTAAPEIFVNDAWVPNPHYRPEEGSA